MTDTAVLRWRSSQVGAAWVAAPLFAVSVYALVRLEQLWRPCWGGPSAACENAVIYGAQGWFNDLFVPVILLCLLGAVITRGTPVFVVAVFALPALTLVDMMTHPGADWSEWFGMLTAAGWMLTAVAAIAWDFFTRRRRRTVSTSLAAAAQH